MASKTEDSGNGGTFQLIVDVVSQSESGNYTKIRVRGILKNVSSSTAYINDPVAVSIGGSVSWDGSASFNLGTGDSKTVIDENFNVTHASDGTKSITVSINMADTGTWTFGNPPTISLSITLPRIAQVPDKIDDLSRVFTAPTQIKLDWTAPDNNGSSITKYQVQQDNNSSFSSPGTSDSTASSFTYPSAGRGTTYWFRVRAVNDRGAGPWSNVVSYSVPNVPDQVPSFSVSQSGVSGIFIDWTAPANNGASITSYDVQWDDNSSFSSPSAYTGNVGSYTATGLAIGKTWYFRVRATNSQGDGAWSPVRSFALPNVPSAPAVPTLTYTPPTTMLIAWSAPSNGGASITGYDIQYADNSAFTSAKSKSVTTLSTTVTDLTVGPTWYFRVRAKNSQGAGAWSAVASKLIVSGPRVNVGGTWKNTVVYVNVAGTWKVATPYVNVSGTWKIAGG